MPGPVLLLLQHELQALDDPAFVLSFPGSRASRPEGGGIVVLGQNGVFEPAEDGVSVTTPTSSTAQSTAS